MGTLDYLFGSILEPVANETDPTQGAALVGYDNETVKDALDQLNTKLTNARTIQTVAATANGQLVFPIPLGYPINLIDVYLVGSHLINGIDYNATDGQNIVLVSGYASTVTAGNNLTVESFGSFAVANALQLSTIGAAGGAALVGTAEGQTVQQFLDSLNSKLTNALVNTSVVATSLNQTVYPIPGGYPINLIDVYAMGVHLDPTSDFTATDGLNVVVSAQIAARMAIGSKLLVHSIGAFNVANAVSLSTLGGTAGASLVGYGSITVKQALDNFTAAQASLFLANLMAWALTSAFRLASSISRDSNSTLLSANIVWPDGTAGVYTTDTVSTSFPGAVDAWHATYVGTGHTYTITQPLVTRDTNGALINQPAITIV